MEKKTKFFGLLGLAGICFLLVAISAGLSPFKIAAGLGLLTFGIGAVLTTNSTQYANGVANPPVMNPSHNDHGKVRYKYFSYTHGAVAGDANSLCNFVKLPPGLVRLIKTESKLICSALGTGRTLDIGYLAHTKQDGTAVNASVDTILDGADVSAIALVTCGAGTNAIGVDPTILFDSREGVTIQGIVKVDTLPIGATFNGYIAYIQD